MTINKEEDLAKVFARFFRETSYDDLPENVREEVKKQVLDLVPSRILRTCPTAS